MECPVSACTCDICRDMCKRPCWPTPGEARGLIELGYASRMMRDYWLMPGTWDEDDEYQDNNIYIICPAERGYEGRGAPFWPGLKGCVLQTEDGLCLIHESGYKPYEARVAGHDAINGDRSLHESTAMMWDSDEGREVVAMWERLGAC